MIGASPHTVSVSGRRQDCRLHTAQAAGAALPLPRPRELAGVELQGTETGASPHTQSLSRRWRDSPAHAPPPAHTARVPEVIVLSVDKDSGERSGSRRPVGCSWGFRVGTRRGWVYCEGGGGGAGKRRWLTAPLRNPHRRFSHAPCLRYRVPTPGTAAAATEVGVVGQRFVVIRGCREGEDS